MPFLIMLLTAPFLAILQGAVLVKLWAWFVVPAVPIVAPLSIPIAIGLALTVSYLTKSLNLDDVDDDKWNAVMKYLFVGLTYPLIVFLFGAIIHSFA